MKFLRDLGSHLTLSSIIAHAIIIAAFSAIGFIFDRYVKSISIGEEVFLKIPLAWGITVIILALLAILSALILYWKRDFRLDHILDIGAFELRLDGAKELIIMNTFLPERDRMEKLIRTAISKDISIRILLLAPTSAEASLRQKMLTGYNLKYEINESIRIVHEVVHASKDGEEKIRLRICSEWIPFSMYSTERSASIGFFFAESLAVLGPQLFIRKKNPRHSDFMNQFEILWKKKSSGDLPIHQDWNTLNRAVREYKGRNLELNGGGRV